MSYFSGRKKKKKSVYTYLGRMIWCNNNNKVCWCDHNIIFIACGWKLKLLLLMRYWWWIISFTSCRGKHNLCLNVYQGKSFMYFHESLCPGDILSFFFGMIPFRSAHSFSLQWVGLEHPFPVHSAGFTPGRDTAVAGESWSSWLGAGESQMFSQKRKDPDSRGEITAELHSGERYRKEISRRRWWRGSSAQAGKELIQK